MPTSKSSRRPGPAVPPTRDWLQGCLEGALREGSHTWVLVGAPGMGKTAFLRDMAARHAGSPIVEIRRPLGTHRPQGFWASLLGQLDLGGSRVPEPAHEAARWASDHLPPWDGSRRFVLVDSLERAPDLVDSSGFAGLDRVLPGVSVVIATRPGAHLDALSAGGASLFWLDPECPENLEELEAWVRSRLGEDASEAVEAVVRHSEGNFMVAGHLVRALQEGTLPVHDLAVTPPSLESALAALWDEVLDDAPADLHDELVRVACALSEAGEPLPAASLADFLGLSASRVRSILARLRPILRHFNEGYRLFHRRMDDFLSRRFRRDLVRVHEQVISFFREAYPSWEEMDDRYGWFYLGHHCDRFARTSRRRDFAVLHWLGEGPYVKAKLAYTHSLGAVLQDLSRCLRASLEDRDLPRIVSYALRIPRLRAREAAQGLRDLAERGRFDLARERARLLRREDSRTKALLFLAWQAVEEGHVELARDLVAEARGILRPDLVDEDGILFLETLAALLRALPAEEVLPLLAGGRSPSRTVSFAQRLGRMERLPREVRVQALQVGIEAARSVEEPSERDRALASLAWDLEALGGTKRRKGSAAKPPEAPPDPEGLQEVLGELRQSEEPGEVFRRALEAASRFRWEPRRAAALAALAAEIAPRSEEEWVGPALEELASALVGLQAPEERQRALVAVVRALSGRPRSAGWREVLARLAAVAETLEEPGLRARGLAWLALARHEARDPRGAQETLNEATTLAFRLAEPEDRGRVLAVLAGCAATAGAGSRARELAFHSLQAWESPAPVRIDAETRSALAMGVAAGVPTERSLELFQTSANAAREIPDLRLRANLLSALAQGLSRLGEEEWARRLQDQALGSARAMEPGVAQAVTLAALAVQESSWGDVARAEQLTREAEQAARSEETPGLRCEALLAVAAARRVGVDEPGAQALIREALAELENLPETELAPALALRQAAALAREGPGAETLMGLLRRARKALKGGSPRLQDEGLLALVQAWLALDRDEEARSVVAGLKDPEARIHGRILVARALIRTRPDEALDLLRRVPVLEERMRGVRECTLELSRDTVASRREQVLDTLAELTLMAVEDEATADVLAGRWVNLIADRKAVVESLRKLGYPLEDLLAGRLPEPTDA